MLKKRLPYIIIGLLFIIQFFQIDKTNSPVDENLDFLKLENPSSEIATMIKNACYDCHSHETEYPWYTSIQPVGWFLRSHFRGGRMNVNFSEWGKNDTEDKKHKMRECAEVIGNKRMPMKSYAFMHGDAKLSDEDRVALVTYFRSK